jgi:hypothetical protein
VRHRYPFEALRWLRRQRVDREAAEVSERAARTALARGDEARAEITRRSSEQRINDVSRAELSRFDENGVRAGELARVGDWRKGAERELAAKQQKEMQAREALRTEVAAEAVARRALGVASNEADLIDGHREAWKKERASAEERSEEEAILEQWTAKRYPLRG